MSDNSSTTATAAAAPLPEVAGPHGDAKAAKAPPARPAHRLQIDQLAVPIALLVMIAGFSIAMPETFFTVRNLQTIIASQAVILLLALATTIPLRAGVFDLSFPSLMFGCAAVAAILTVKHGWSLEAAALAAFVAALAGGVLNGYLVAVIGIDSFIATLGTGSLFIGGAYYLTGLELISGVPEDVTNFARAEFLGLPAAAWYAWIIAAVLWAVYEYTPYGRRLLFVGGNPEASRLVGLPVRRLRWSTYVWAALICAFAGLLMIGQLGAFDASTSATYLLQPIAAAFLGAAAIQTGRFNVVGTVIGVYLLAVGVTGLQLIGVPAWVSSVFNGATLILAVGFARLASRRPA
jgi:ribose transport system permease protein